MDQGVKRALAVSTEIVKQNPAGVSSLFRRYGIAAKPTGQNLFFAMVKHKGPFVDDLFDAVESPYSGVDGSISPLPPIKPTALQLSPIKSTMPGTAPEPEKKNRFFNFMNNVMSTAAGAVDVLNKAKSGGTSTSSDGGTYAGGGGATPEAGSKNMILIGVGIVVVLVLAVFLIRKK